MPLNIPRPRILPLMVLIWLCGLRLKHAHPAPSTGLLHVLDDAEAQLINGMQVIMMEDASHVVWTPLLPVRVFMGKVVQNFVKALQHPANSLFQIFVTQWEDNKPMPFGYHNFFHPFGNVSFNFGVSFDLMTNGGIGFIKVIKNH